MPASRHLAVQRVTADENYRRTELPGAEPASGDCAHILQYDIHSEVAGTPALELHWPGAVVVRASLLLAIYKCMKPTPSSKEGVALLLSNDTDSHPLANNWLV